MKRPLILSTFLAMAVLVLCRQAGAADSSPRIADLNLRQGEEQVLLAAKLITHMDEKMREAIRGGVPVVFRFSIRLTRSGTIFGERIIRDTELTHQLDYDPVKQSYQMTAEGYGSEKIIRTTKSEEEALEWLTVIREWPLYPLAKLDRKRRYRVRVMATLRSVELPSVLGYLFFFTTIFNQETPWVQVDFTY